MSNMTDDEIVSTVDGWEKTRQREHQKLLAAKQKFYRDLLRKVSPYIPPILGMSLILGVFVFAGYAGFRSRQIDEARAAAVEESLVLQYQEALDVCVQALDAETCTRVHYTEELGRLDQRVAYNKCLGEVGAEVCSLLK